MVQTLKAVNQVSIAEAQFKDLLFHGILLQKSVKLQTVKFDSKVSIGLLMDTGAGQSLQSMGYYIRYLYVK